MKKHERSLKKQMYYKYKRSIWIEAWSTKHAMDVVVVHENKNSGYLEVYIALQKKDMICKIKQDFEKNTKPLLSLPMCPVSALLTAKQHTFLSCISISAS